MMTRQVAHEHHCRCGATYDCPPGCTVPIRVNECTDCRPVLCDGCALYERWEEGEFDAADPPPASYCRGGDCANNTCPTGARAE